MTDAPLPAVSYAGCAIGLQAMHCRKEAARFLLLAQREPLAQMRRYLTRLAHQYEELAASQAVRTPPGQNPRARD
jgi:hypothetical protein